MSHGVALADLHCGHQAGLTPEEWWFNGSGPQRAKWRKLQRELWAEYRGLVDKIGPVDFLLVNADCIDGRGERSGSTEVITTSRLEQVEMAVECLKLWEAKQVVLSRGTPYHVGVEEDFEDLIAQSLGGYIKDHPFIDIEGVMFDMKHHIGTSSIPHGRSTALGRDWMWNALWAARQEQPKADVLLRAHTHYFRYTGEEDWLAMILPALQAASTKYGARQCSGRVSWGVVEWWCEGGEYRWQPHVLQLKANKVAPIKL